MLDEIEKIKKLDKSNMVRDIQNMPDSIEEAIRISRLIDIPKEINKDSVTIKYTTPKNVIIIGMGGSAIGGDLLKEFLFDKLTIPLDIIRGYEVPRYISQDTLVIIISYSGNTEETLSGFKESLEKKAMVVCISSNGLLNEICNKLNLPIIAIPKNIQPRASLPFLFFPLLVIMNKLGLTPEFQEEIDETISLLKKMLPSIDINTPTEKNLAKQVALKLFNKISLIFSPPRFGSVARRMKCQLNENSKNLAFWNEFSELDHNEVVGWERKLDIQKEFVLILIRSDLESLSTTNRINITRDLIFSGKVYEIIELKGKGKGMLPQFFSVILIGDFISYYLAILNQIDPSPVRDISKLKKELKNQYDLIEEIRKRFL